MLQPSFAGAARFPVLVPKRRPARTVLLVEDEWLIAELMAETLADDGYRVLRSADAHEALQLLRNDKVDLLFTDIDLARGTNGVVLAREARALEPRLQVVYTSGGCAQLSRDQAVSGSTFVAKPYRPEHVCELIAALLDQAD
jgi:CheY-like chemotaxis protein